MTSNSHILRISDENTYRLVELYGQERCLWDKSTEDYRDRRKRLAAANKIVKMLDIKNFQTKHVMMKFKNLRNSYRQELKKIAHSKELVENGTPGAQVYRPRVFWFDLMDSFLRPVLQMQSQIPSCHKSSHDFDDDNSTEEMSQSTTNASNAESDGEIHIKLEIEEEQLLPSTGWIKATDDAMDSEENTSLNNEEIQEMPEEIPVVTRNRVIKPQAPCKCSQETVKMLKALSKQVSSMKSKTDDAFGSFGRYVAALLRDMPSSRAAQLQPKIVALLLAPPATRSD